MAVKVTKPEIDIREKISELDKPSGIAGEAMLRAETPRQQQELIGAGRKNLIINGDFRVSQRGDYTSATATTHNQLYLDRWVVRLTNVTANIQHILGTNSSPGYPFKDSNSLRLTATNSATGVMRHLQRVEGFLSGRTLTVSAWVKSNSPNARIFSYQHNGGSRESSQPHSGSGSWEYLTLTTVNDANSANQLYFDIALASETFTNIAITSGEYVEISEVQMEVGNVATPFECRLYGEELALCQRYCYVVGDPNKVIYLGTGSMYTSTAANVSLPLPVQLRHSDPTITVVSHGGNWLNLYVGATGTISNATPLSGDYTQSNMRIYIPNSHSGSSPSAPGAGIWCMVIAGAKLIISAEM
jgi:hypothetical protein